MPQENAAVTCNGHARFLSRVSRCAQSKLDSYEFQIQSNRVKRTSDPSNITSIQQGGLTTEKNASNVFRVHYAGGI